LEEYYLAAICSSKISWCFKLAFLIIYYLRVSLWKWLLIYFTLRRSLSNFGLILHQAWPRIFFYPHYPEFICPKTRAHAWPAIYVNFSYRDLLFQFFTDLDGLPFPKSTDSWPWILLFNSWVCALWGRDTLVRRWKAKPSSAGGRVPFSFRILAHPREGNTISAFPGPFTFLGAAQFPSVI